MNPIIAIRGLTKDYDTDAGPVRVLTGLELTIGAGEFVAIMGPSGSGKSTLMNILGCLDAPTSGTYELLGQDVSRISEEALARARSRDLGFVFQGYNLLPRLTLKANVALPLVYQGFGRSERIHRATTVLEQLGLGELLNSKPPKISGGQQQRVAVARALVTQPQVILADEPTGNLDSRTGKELMALLQDINRERRITIVLVTHDLTVARYAQRLIYLRDGHIDYDGLVDGWREAAA
jgi:putative ABC transport system ATP-binding protein